MLGIRRSRKGLVRFSRQEITAAAVFECQWLGFFRVGALAPTRAAGVPLRFGNTVSHAIKREMLDMVQRRDKWKEMASSVWRGACERTAGWANTLAGRCACRAQRLGASQCRWGDHAVHAPAAGWVCAGTHCAAIVGATQRAQAGCIRHNGRRCCCAWSGRCVRRARGIRQPPLPSHSAQRGRRSVRQNTASPNDRACRRGLQSSRPSLSRPGRV